jgi:hypothetical protein
LERGSGVSGASGVGRTAAVLAGKPELVEKKVA